MKREDRTHFAQCINLYGHMTSNLTVRFQNDTLLNFLLKASEIFESDNFVCLPHCLHFFSFFLSLDLYYFFQQGGGFTIAQSF